MAPSVQSLWDTDPDFPSTQEWKDFTSNAVRSTDNVWYANESIANYDKANLKQPKMYRWVTEDSFRKRQAKEGQSIQETAAQRVAQYQTLDRKVIMIVLYEKHFVHGQCDLVQDVST
jgi:hypothetical protein